MVSLRSGTMVSPAPIWEVLILPVDCSAADGELEGSASVLSQSEPLILDDSLRTPLELRILTTDDPSTTIQQSAKEADPVLNDKPGDQASVAKGAESLDVEREATAALGCETDDHEVTAKEADGASSDLLMGMIGGSRDVTDESMLKPGEATSSPLLDREAAEKISCDGEADAEPVGLLNAMPQIIAQQCTEGSSASTAGDELTLDGTLGENMPTSDRSSNEVGHKQRELTEDWVGDGLSDQGSQSSEQAGKRKRSKYMLSGDGTGESPCLIEETPRRSKRKKTTVKSYIGTENLWMSDTTKDLADAVEGLKEVIELLDAQMDMIGDGAAMINTEISRICEEQMESLKRSIEYISRCGVEEEKYTKKWKAL